MKALIIIAFIVIAVLAFVKIGKVGKTQEKQTGMGGGAIQHMGGDDHDDEEHETERQES